LLGADIARAVLSHHERADGLGYPNALRRNQIPVLARIVQICDAWCAMTDPQGYQPPEEPEGALAKLALASGSQFDAELCDAFVAMKRGHTM
jgi:HD-GYP domain-containing protein (c-di-GMP phosphodiesterase class II)